MIFLLDSTVLIDVLRERNGRRELLVELVRSGHTLATSAINLGEVYAGMRTEETARTEEFLAALECYPLTGVVARRAGTLKSEWARRGTTLSLADMIVAATALEAGAELVTDNRKDFPVEELRVYPLG